MGVEVKVVHNASVMNAIGVCGLQLYRYGETISVPFFTETWRPDSFYEKIKQNRLLGLHTLCLLGEVLPAFISSNKKDIAWYISSNLLELPKHVYQILCYRHTHAHTSSNLEQRSTDFCIHNNVQSTCISVHFKL